MGAKKKARDSAPATRVKPRLEVLASASGPVELRLVDSPDFWRYLLEPGRGKPRKALQLEFNGGSVLLDAGDCLSLAEKLTAFGLVMRDLQKLWPPPPPEPKFAEATP